MKRLLDVLLSAFGLLVSLPLLAPLCLLIWLQDFHSPFYVSWRLGRRGRKYRMVKLRSMIVWADRTGVDSAPTSDPRITPVGGFIRKFKLDELPQLWNVLKGDMSLVGPRPQVERETHLYTEAEKHLLDIRPGITDLASIVFSDQADILEGHPDPGIAYGQLIRPYKSRLGLLYVRQAGLWLDLKIIVLTVIALLSRPLALAHVEKLVRSLGAPEDLCRVASRREALKAAPPPGATAIVTSRGVD
jgi:lipopolysaccharide/colanic/teichoic acid biosynthesis glycosyltransferase